MRGVRLLDGSIETLCIPLQSHKVTLEGFVELKDVVDRIGPRPQPRLCCACVCSEFHSVCLSDKGTISRTANMFADAESE